MLDPIARPLSRRLGRLLFLLGALLAGVGLVMAWSRSRGMAGLRPEGRVERAALPSAPAGPTATVARSDAAVEALLATAGIPSRLPTATADPDAASRPVADWIRIPSVAVDTMVLPVGWTGEANATGEGAQWKTADFAAGWHFGSAPLGMAGNTVISGHNNLAGAVFKRLAEVQVGDEVVLRAGEDAWSYVVERRFIVPEEGVPAEKRAANARWIDASPDERVTLISCWPPWGNSHRVIVVAKPRRVGATPPPSPRSP